MPRFVLGDCDINFECHDGPYSHIHLYYHNDLYLNLNRHQHRQRYYDRFDDYIDRHRYVLVLLHCCEQRQRGTGWHYDRGTTSQSRRIRLGTVCVLQFQQRQLHLRSRSCYSAAAIAEDSFPVCDCAIDAFTLALSCNCGAGDNQLWSDEVNGWYISDGQNDDPYLGPFGVPQDTYYSVTPVVQPILN
ncbi:hypothetical protein BDY17DRAFT_293828 [Neohortaea acidophila]|uniref:Uncharacterized protein n=1 Tax=Neohortaea acidophila TaxID=245834 RepID=A0A6A6Q0N2_9PEZI|nr:uncharacterized protein BDY17DRAFT_293828 [Neohortaea acidophila]KAF2485546.1 hypothetical protein BDY17DRAFT_293828 [Neohortaea acidophila]